MLDGGAFSRHLVPKKADEENSRQGLQAVQGEEQQKLDIEANSMFINFLRNSYTCCFLVSEEMDNVVEVEPEKQA